jgi:hypothetical protein
MITCHIRKGVNRRKDVEEAGLLSKYGRGGSLAVNTIRWLAGFARFLEAIDLLTCLATVWWNHSRWYWRPLEKHTPTRSWVGPANKYPTATTDTGCRPRPAWRHWLTRSDPWVVLNGMIGGV